MNKILLATILLAYGTANAATTTYLDRVSFEGASASLTIETFNSFVTEESFHTTPLDVGDFTLSMTGSPSTASIRNKIDIPPHEFSGFNVDGTPVANVLTFFGESLILTFDNPIYSFGADFGGFNDGHLRTNVLVDGITYSPAIDGTFWGIVSDTAFSAIEFLAVTNDGYGIDNVSYSTSSVGAVPVPAALFMFAPALLGFMGLRRKVKATTA